ncbi:hypothetical protein T484DRAFT_1875652, partial [Baffinella frigidus]
MAGRQRRQLLAAVAILLLASLASASPALPSKNSPFCAAAKTPSFPHPPLPRQRDLAHACEAAVTHRGVHQDPLLLRLRGGGGGADAGSPGQERRVNMELQTHVGDDEDDFPEVEFKMEAEEMAKVILRVRVPGGKEALFESNGGERVGELLRRACAVLEGNAALQAPQLEDSEEEVSGAVAKNGGNDEMSGDSGVGSRRRGKWDDEDDDDEEGGRKANVTAPKLNIPSEWSPTHPDGIKFSILVSDLPECYEDNGQHAATRGTNLQAEGIAAAQMPLSTGRSITAEGISSAQMPLAAGRSVTGDRVASGMAAGVLENVASAPQGARRAVDDLACLSLEAIAEKIVHALQPLGIDIALSAAREDEGGEEGVEEGVLSEEALAGVQDADLIRALASLSVEEMTMSSCLNARLRVLSGDDLVWKLLFLRDFPAPAGDPEGGLDMPPRGGSFREAYREAMSIKHPFDPEWAGPPCQ